MSRAQHPPLGPIASYQAWKDKGRHVKRGEKALWLWLPISVKVTDPDHPEAEPSIVTRFVMKPHWFVYAQTDGKEIQPDPIPEWDRTRALASAYSGDHDRSVRAIVITRSGDRDR
jgi:hypothetical protein